MAKIFSQCRQEKSVVLRQQRMHFLVLDGAAIRDLDVLRTASHRVLTLAPIVLVLVFHGTIDIETYRNLARTYYPNRLQQIFLRCNAGQIDYGKMTPGITRRREVLVVYGLPH